MASYYISRGSSEWFGACQRAWYHARVNSGRGIEPVGKTSLPIAYGEVFHAACAQIAQGGDIEETVERALDALTTHLHGEYSDEQALDQMTLLEGHIRGFHKVVLPGILSTDDILGVEQDVSDSWRSGDDTFHVPSIVDLLTVRRSDGAGTYHELKTSKWADDSRWMKGWQRSVQLMVGCEGATKALGRPITRAIVHGFPTGYADRETGRLTHGLVNGWRNVSSVAIGLHAKRPRAWKGWESFHVSEHPGGVEAWMVDLPSDELASLFTQTEPIGVDAYLVERWKAQEAHRAVRVANAKRELAESPSDEWTDAILDREFPQNFRECDGFKRCEYLDACWIGHIARDPIGSGLFVPRTPQPLEAKIIAMQEEAGS